MDAKLALKAGIVTLLIPGMVVGLVPFLISAGSADDWPNFAGWKILSLVAGALGMMVLLHSIWSFAFYGQGTLAPVDPPKALVVHGFYRHVRNPMYLAVSVILLSEATFFASSGLLAYSAAVFLGFHLFVVGYEEPRLRRQFGRSYEEYCRKVHRWQPVIHASPSVSQ